MKYKTIFILLGISVIIIIGAVIFTDNYLYQQNNSDKPNVILQRASIEEGLKLLKKGGTPKEIYALLASKSLSESTSSFVLIEAAKLFLAIGKKKDALICLNKVWQKDQRNPNTILLLLNAYEGNSKERFDKIAPFLLELPKNPINEQFSASTYQDLKKGAKARDIWERLMEENFQTITKLRQYKLDFDMLNSEYADKIAALNSDAPDYESKKHKLERKLKNAKIDLENKYDTYITSYLKEYKEAMNNHERFIHQITESLLLENKLAKAIIFLTNSLKTVDAVSAKSLNLLLSLHLHGKNMKEVDRIKKQLLDMHKNSGELLLKEAVLEIYKGNINKAKEMLEKNSLNSFTDISGISAAYNNRMYLALMRLFIDGENAEYQDLIASAYDSKYTLNEQQGSSDIFRLNISTKDIEQELLFYKTLTQMTENPEEAISIFKKNIHLMPNHPVVDYLIIKGARANNKLVSSIDRINKIAKTQGMLGKVQGLHGLFIYSPVFAIEMAESLYQLGAEEKALNILNSIHSRDIFTNESLKLHLRIALEKGQLDEIEKLAESISKSSVPIEIKEQLTEFLINNDILDNIEILNSLAKDTNQKLPLEMLLLIKNDKYNEAILLADNISDDLDYNSLIKGKIYYMAGNNKEAEKLLKKSLNQSKNYLGYREYADFLLKQNRLKESKKIYEAILEANPKDITAIIGIATIDEQTNNLDKALELLISNINLNNPELILKVAKLFIKKQDYPAAIKFAEEVLKMSGKNNEALLIKSIAMINIYKNLPSTQNKKILLSMESYIEKDNLSYNSASIALIEIAYSLKDYKKVIDLTSKYMKTNQKNPFLLEKYIISSLYIGNKKDAEDAFRQNSKVFNKLTVAYIKSEILLANGKKHEAIECLLSTSNRDFTLKAAIISLQSGNLKKAKELVQSINPTCHDWLILAGEAEKKSTGEALVFYKLAYSINPDNPIVLNNYSWTLAKAKDISMKDQAIAMAKKAYSTLPNNNTYQTYLFVLTQYKEKQLKEKQTESK